MTPGGIGFAVLTVDTSDNQTSAEVAAAQRRIISAGCVKDTSPRGPMERMAACEEAGGGSTPPADICSPHPLNWMEVR